MGLDKFASISMILILIASSSVMFTYMAEEKDQGTKTLIIGLEFEVDKEMIREAGGENISNETVWHSVTAEFPEDRAADILNDWESKDKIEWVREEDNPGLRSVIICFEDDVDNDTIKDIVEEAGGENISEPTPWNSVTADFPKKKVDEIMNTWEDRPQIEYVEANEDENFALYNPVS